MENNTSLRNHFILLVEYNGWATKETVNSIKKLEKEDDRIIELLSHIVAAQTIWLNRILERNIYANPWEKHTISESISQSTTITTEWINLLESFKDKDLERRVEYKNTKGEKFTNTIKDIIIHVINHSTYHRAQIAQGVKALGGKPAVTDYIVYQRQFHY
jgi:uncharacterized damage-inducible protein DinB